ncbi:unnamed protein product, partial [Allacma fusca]
NFQDLTPEELNSISANSQQNI